MAIPLRSRLTRVRGPLPVPPPCSSSHSPPAIDHRQCLAHQAYYRSHRRLFHTGQERASRGPPSAATPRWYWLGLVTSGCSTAL